MSDSWFVASQEVRHPQHPLGGPGLCLQWGVYHFKDKRPDEWGYRIIWRRDDNSIQSRPCRIPSISDIDTLVNLAKIGNWAHHGGATVAPPQAQLNSASSAPQAPATAPQPATQSTPQSPSSQLAPQPSKTTP